MQTSAGVSPYLAQNIKHFKAIGGFDSMLKYLRQSPPTASLSMTKAYTKLLCKVYILLVFGCVPRHLFATSDACWVVLDVERLVEKHA